MQNNKAINFYAALAISIIVSIIISSVVFLGSVLSNQQSNNTYGSNFESFIVISAILLLVTLFFGLPALLSSRYGWKTIVVTVIFQSILVFCAVSAMAAITTANQPEQPPVYPLDY